ncbi:MAG: hypothetical protein VW226_07425 [Rhodospirillaceae bacterium]
MKKFLLSLPLFSSLAFPAIAAEGHAHHGHSERKGFYAHLETSVLYESIYSAPEASEEIEQTYSHSHLGLGYRINPNFSIDSIIKLEGEPAGHAHGGEAARTGDQFFDAHPLILEALTLTYRNKALEIYGGKFNPELGFNYHSWPGLFGYQVAEGYMLKEHLGIGAKLAHDAGDYGRHSINVTSFFKDTLLSGSLLHNRGRRSKSDGGLANTERLNSYAVSLGGQDFFSLDNNFVEGLSYRLGYAKQAAGSGNESPETRFSTSIAYEKRVTANAATRVFVERMAIGHLGGETAHNRIHTTLGFSLDYKNWNIGGTHTHINNDAGEADENHDGYIGQISMGYIFENGINISIGYKQSKEENERKDRIGTKIAYNIEF